MKTSQLPALLVRDRYFLDRVAKHLKNDRRAFFSMVCPPDVVPIAVEYLREQSGKDVPAPKRITDPDEILQILWDLNVAPSSEVVSVNISGKDIDVWTAFNFHRDKLLRGGRLLLFLDTLDDMLAFQRHAPDAYSFRESVFVIEGAPAGAPETADETEEPYDIRTARLLYELKKRPEDKAEAAFMLAKAFDERGRYDDAAHVAMEGLALIPREQYTRNHERRARADLSYILVEKCKMARQWIRCNQISTATLDDLGNAVILDDPGRFIYFQIYATISPHYWSKRITDDLKIRLPKFSGRGDRNGILGAIARGDHARGRYTNAQDAEREIASQLMNSLGKRAVTHTASAEMNWIMGRFRQARSDIHAADELLMRTFRVDDRTRQTNTHLLIDQGELDAAENLAKSLDDPHSHLAIIAANRGDLATALQEFHEAIATSIAAKADVGVYRAATSLVAIAHSFHAAHALSPADLERAIEIIDSAGKWLIDLADHNPVWYDVLVPGLRAQILILFDNRQEEAIAEAEKAVSFACTQWTQALPRSLRIHVQCLAHAGRWNDIGPVILDGMKAARDEDHLIELAMFQAYDLAHLVRKMAKQERIDTARRVLRDTFAEMSAPRVEGDTWLEIVPYLPLDTKSIDLIEIGDHVYDLYTEMPMPERAARTMEWIGDIYVSKNNRKEAENAYRMALKPLIQHGFGLRRPIVQEKLDHLATPKA